MRTSIAFTDSIGAVVLENGKPRPFDRFASWTPKSRPGGEGAARQSDLAITMVRFRNEYRVSFELPGIPSIVGANELLRAREFQHASWVKTNATITTGLADPFGGNEACMVTATAVNATVVQNLGGGTAAVRTNSLWMRRRTGTGTIRMQYPDGSGTGVVVLTEHWQRFELTGASSATRDFGILIATNGDAIDVFHGQLEAAAYAGYPMTTVSTVVAATTMSEIADRLGYHLENGGTCTVNTGDISDTVHSTARLQPGSSPELRLTDRELMEYTLSLQLLLTSAPVCRYFR